MNVWLEVRCCCQPRKLLGWLPVQRGDALEGSRVSFALWNTVSPIYTDEPPKPQGWPRTTVSLRVREFTESRLTLCEDRLGQELITIRREALSSEETPIEDLRRIPGFVEAR